MSEQKTKDDKGNFVQFPIVLISGCPSLTRDDKWVLLSIMEGHWTEESFKLSYREVAAISGVPLSLLSSYTDKKGVLHEGIMDRIERVTGYIHRFMGKEVSATGKPKGNAQSYIKINYAKIWQDNCEYSKVKKNLSVSNTNRLDPQPVLHTNEPVLYANTSVSIPNRLVSNTNRLDPLTQPVEPVSAFPYITGENSQITGDKNEENGGPPTPPYPDDSFIHSSSDLNSNSPDVYRDPIAIETGTATLGIQQKTFDAQGYKNPESTDKASGITQAQLEQWVKSAGVALGLPASCKKAVDRLLPLIKVEQDVKTLITIERKRHPQGIIYIANLAKEDVIAEWQQIAEVQPDISIPEKMDYSQALNFARSLTQTYAPYLLGVNEMLPGIWSTCLQYGPGDNDWLDFAGPAHYSDPSPWERQQMQKAIAYDDLIAQREAIAI